VTRFPPPPLLSAVVGLPFSLSVLVRAPGETRQQVCLPPPSVAFFVFFLSWNLSFFAFPPPLAPPRGPVFPAPPLRNLSIYPFKTESPPSERFRWIPCFFKSPQLCGFPLIGFTVSDSVCPRPLRVGDYKVASSVPPPKLRALPEPPFTLPGRQTPSVSLSLDHLFRPFPKISGPRSRSSPP